MKKDAKILIVGDGNLVGARLIRYFKEHGFRNTFGDTMCSIDTIDQHAVKFFFQKIQPDYVFLTPIKYGGIKDNIHHPAEFMYVNLQVQMNVIHSSYINNVQKLFFFGSSCVYPRDSQQPMNEDCLLNGPLEKTSEPYALAKIAGIEMCTVYNKQHGTHFVSLIPATMYGPEDHFDVESGHVISSLITKFHEAKIRHDKTVTVWGSGNQRREFIFIDDVIDACMMLLHDTRGPDVINIGSGTDISIKELALLIRTITGFSGGIVFDTTHPEGPYQKLLDTKKLNERGWKPATSLTEGIHQTYSWFLKNKV